MLRQFLHINCRIRHPPKPNRNYTLLVPWKWGTVRNLMLTWWSTRVKMSTENMYRVPGFRFGMTAIGTMSFCGIFPRNLSASLSKIQNEILLEIQKSSFSTFLFTRLITLFVYKLKYPPIKNTRCNFQNNL